MSDAIIRTVRPSRWLLAAVLAAGACDGASMPPTESSVGESTSQEADMLVLATVQTAEGTELTFIEPAPGTLLVTERGTVTNPPIGPGGKGRSERAIDLFRRRAPGRALPAALAEAQERFDRTQAQIGETVAANAETVTAKPDDRVGLTTHALEDGSPNDGLVPASWFVATQCPNQSAKKKTCLVRRTGDETFGTSDVHFLDSNVASYRGTVRVRVRQKTWWSWSTKHDFNVQAGEVWWVHWSSGTLDADVEQQFREASGDGYHFFAAAYNGLRTYN